MITMAGGRVGAIFNLTGLAKTAYEEISIDDEMNDAKHLFLVLKVFEEDLKASARDGAGWLVNFTAMDGQFGLKGKRSFPIGQAGSVGVMKSVAREWANVKVKTIDLDPDADPKVLASRVLRELAVFDDLVEVGLDAEGRWKIDLVEEDSDSKVRSLRPVGSESVILVTGGAYGITSHVTKALASKYQPQIIIVGRSSFQQEESAETRDLQGPQALRKFLIEASSQKGTPLTPAAIERQVQTLLKERQIRRNLQSMRDSGARVEYHTMDVCDAERFALFIDDIYERFGRIDGLIHGAGVNSDSQLRHKTPESFQKVYDTKVVPAKVLATKLRPEKLNFLVFFSSTSGRFGTAGQPDYSAANEVLNKFAVHLDRIWPARVVAINWGPWESGMVTEELGKLFIETGIHLISNTEGARMFLEELQHSGDGVPEVVITRSAKLISEANLAKTLSELVAG
jgi:NAD(P)-dependent dehydrogenase (short-subunit alcohol dehydrogenase family)